MGAVTEVGVISVVLLACVFAMRPDYFLPASFETSSAADSEERMRAVKYAEHGASTTLIHGVHPRPEPLSDQLLVKVDSAAINPCDFKFRRNWAPSFIIPKPKVPGEDIAGVVVSPAGDFKKGDRVTAMMPILGTRWGASAEYAAVKTTHAARVADSVPLNHAASLPLVALTVVQGFANACGVQEGALAGKKVLIHAGAGGVGTFAIQWAKHYLKADVVATTCSEKSFPLVKSLGADLAIDYRQQQFEDALSGFDVVLDPMSYAYEQRTLWQPLGGGSSSSLLKTDGSSHYLNVIGSNWRLSAAGAEIANGLPTALNYLLFKGLHLLRAHIVDKYCGAGTSARLGWRGPNYDIVAVSPNGPQLQLIMDLVENGTIKAIVDRTFPLEKASEAHEYLEQGHAKGKVLLDMSP